MDEQGFLKKITDLEEELQYYKSKCASLETGLFNFDREIEHIRNRCKKIEKERDGFLHNLDSLEQCILQVKCEFSDSKDVQKAIERIIILKRSRDE